MSSNNRVEVEIDRGGKPGGPAANFSCSVDLSEDLTLVGLAKQDGRQFDVAMTASAFTTLLATLSEEQGLGWELPVRVLRGAKSDAPVLAAHRMVVFDKPLQPRLLSLQQKHERLYKAAVTSLGTGEPGEHQSLMTCSCTCACCVKHRGW